MQSDNVFRFDRGQHLRAVGGHNELRVRERLRQVCQHALLPCGMQVEFDLVNQDNPLGGERVSQMRVALEPFAGRDQPRAPT